MKSTAHSWRRRIEGVGGDEVEPVGVDRIPRTVFRPQERRDAGGFARRIDLCAGHAAHVAEIDQREVRRVVGAERCRAVRSVVAGAGEIVDLDTEQMTAGEAGLVDGIAGRLLVADVEVDLSVLAIVHHADDGLVAGMGVRHDVFVGHVAEPASS